MLLLIASLLLSSTTASAEPVDTEADEARPQSEAEEEEESDLRERLTEREDKRRPEEPWSIDVFGRPLTVGGQYEVFLFHLEQMEFGDPPADAGRLLLEQEFELEAFYSIGPPLSLFAQVRFGMEEDLDSGTPDSVSDLFVERGEMWIHSEGVLLPGLAFEIGRLNFEDDRRWWWDVDLDSVRVSYETDTFEVTATAAFEVGASHSGLGIVEPENDDVFRFLSETSWDWSANNALQFFVLFQDDGSGVERPGKIVSGKREDESDAQLTWVGARATGAWDGGSRGIFGYWVDAAYVWGDETLVEFEEISHRESIVVGNVDQRVSGWGIDVGATWILPSMFEPRITLAYARGSGDRKPDSGTDRSFRQTSLQGNEAGFGGVRSFPNYGVLLEPELANLQIVTVDLGFSIFRASSLDLAYHYYRQVEPSEFLRDSNLDATLSGQSRDLGHALDLVLAIQEWSWLEIDLVGSAFKAGDAFGADRDEWTYGGVLGVTLVF